MEPKVLLKEATCLQTLLFFLVIKGDMPIWEKGIPNQQSIKCNAFSIKKCVCIYIYIDCFELIKGAQLSHAISFDCNMKNDKKKIN